jgi:hypothetical protein
MKNKIIATIAAFSLVGSAHAVDVNDNLSISGFIDGSYQSEEQTGSADTQQLGIDEVEIDFLFNVSNVSGEVHVDNGANGSSDFRIEQAHFSYSLENGVNFTFGRFGSSLGFEREDPAGVYTSSRAYDDDFNFGNVNNNVFDGIAVGYSAEQFSINAAFVNETAQRAALEGNDLDLELSINYTGIENLNIGLGYYFDNESVSTSENDVLNIHASTSFGKLFLAAEYSEIANDTNGDRDAYMLLADYDISDKFGIAVRVSSYEVAGNTDDVDKLTIAPNYSITDSLGVIVEYSDIDEGTTDTDSIAVELTYTF